MKNKKEITIYDLAAELKVSPSTISRALKNHKSIGKDTTLAVKKLARKRGYRPNQFAVSLRKNKTNSIGVMVSWINRPFISSLISGIEEEASKAGFNVIISQSRDNYEKEITGIQALYDSRTAGLIVSLAMETRNLDHFQPFMKKNIPLVMVDRVAGELDTDRVVIDNFQAGFDATTHLIEQGCTRIAHFAGAQHRNIYHERMEGYLAALKKNDLPVDENLILFMKNLSPEEGIEKTRYLLDLSQPPDGIFSANDSAAVSAIQCARERNILIPDQLAVIGFNNDPVSLIIDPPLSTIGHPGFDMGKIAARQVLNRLEPNKGLDKPETITLKTEILIRKSSLRVK